eukprot:4015545-Amphidinium_carterae.1
MEEEVENLDAALPPATKRKKASVPKSMKLFFLSFRDRVKKTRAAGHECNARLGNGLQNGPRSLCAHQPGHRVGTIVVPSCWSLPLSSLLLGCWDV